MRLKSLNLLRGFRDIYGKDHTFIKIDQLGKNRSIVLKSSIYICFYVQIFTIMHEKQIENSLLTKNVD